VAEGDGPHRISATRLVPWVLAGLVVAAVAPVLVPGWLTTRDGSSRFLRDRAEIVLDRVSDSVREVLAPAAALAASAAHAVAEGRLHPDRTEAWQAFVSGALAAAPQVTAIAIQHPGGETTAWRRDADAARSDPAGHLLDSMRPSTAAWAAPAVSLALAQPVFAWSEPLHDPTGARLGAMLVLVGGRDLSRRLAQLRGERGITPFLLVERQAVLAHPALVSMPMLGGLPSLQQVGDAALEVIWRAPLPLTASNALRRAEGHWSPVPGGEPHTFLYRDLASTGELRLTVGFHQPVAVSRRERWAHRALLGLSLVLLSVSTWVALRLGRSIARPAVLLAAAAEAIETSRFAEVREILRPLEGSRVREVVAAAEALGSAAQALQTFETYVPRALVRRLRRSGAAGAPREAELTLLFLDLEGSSEFAESRDADEVSAYVNAVLGIAGPCIEATGGTIDKFTGDGLLAFWGAPEARADHARAALLASLALVAPLAGHHASREAAGLQACRVRIGLHTGRVVVGDVGYAGRLNYTVIGKAVNVAARVQAALRGVAPESPVLVAATPVTLAAAGPVQGVRAVTLPGDPQLGPALRLIPCG
jgi:adenylate cyclase